MKNLKLFFLLFTAAVLAAGCRDVDDNPRPNPPSITGAWTLININGSIMGTSHDFDPGVITWTFNPPAGKITVVNNNENENVEDSFESGTYRYTYVYNDVTSQICSHTLMVDAVNMGCYTIENDSLVVSNVEADGYMLTFVRPSIASD